MVLFVLKLFFCYSYYSVFGFLALVLTVRRLDVLFLQEAESILKALNENVLESFSTRPVLSVACRVYVVVFSEANPKLTSSPFS